VKNDTVERLTSNENEQDFVTVAKQNDDIDEAAEEQDASINNREETVPKKIIISK